MTAAPAPELPPVCIDCLGTGTVRLLGHPFWTGPIWLCDPCWVGYLHISRLINGMLGAIGAPYPGHLEQE